jgi:hypothetical protein
MAAIDLRNTFDYSENGVNGTATKNSTTNLDIKITEDKIYLNGAEILYQDAAWGDYVILQVIDIDNILGHGTNTVLKEYVHKRYIHPDETTDQVVLPYAGNVLKDLYLRVKYTSVSTTTDVKVAVNYFLHQLED